MRLKTTKLELVFCLLVLSFTILILNIDFSRKIYLNDYEAHEYYSNKFSDDSIILNISDICSNSINPVKCVFDEIPMNYDYGRIEYSESNFRNPEDYFIFGGVCRDVTVLRSSALSNLGIYCLFDFSEELHVFLVCAYDGKFYELNNGDFIER